MISFDYLPPSATSGLLAGISFVQGDLTEILRESPVDALLVSAFENDYTETPSSLIGALGSSGVSVAELAQNKADDLRSVGRCWISQQLPPDVASRLGFKHIICFERRESESLAENIMAIGRALSVVATTHNVSSVAMPLLGTGDQGYALSDVMPTLLETLTRHMRPGARLKHVVIAAFTESRIPEIRSEVARFRSRPASTLPRHDGPDVFISYRHTNKKSAEYLVEAITRARPETQIWIDRDKLEIGYQWNETIAGAIDTAQLFVPCYSKDYFASPICMEELTAAHIRRRNIRKSFIAPVLLDDVKLTSFHQVTQYFDSRGGDEQLKEAAQRIVARLGSGLAKWEFSGDGCEHCGPHLT